MCHASVGISHSGKLELISDPALRAAIISYFYRIDRVEAALDKNNASFIDQAHCDFLMGKSIPPRDWDSCLMGRPLALPAALTSAFKEAAGATSPATTKASPSS